MNELVYVDVIEELKKEIEDIKLKISALLQEKEDLEYNICPALKSEYYEKIGKIEIQIKMLELTADEYKYRISVIQAALNRREKMSEERVNEKVDKKYSEYRKSVNDAYEKAEKEKAEEEERKNRQRENYEKYTKNAKAENRSQSDATTKKEDKDNTSSNADTNGGSGENGTNAESSDLNKDDSYKKMSYAQKVKELYRRIVKKLHPDMNPDITEHEKELFYATLKANKEGDLEKLEEIYAEIMDAEDTSLAGNDTDSLERLKEIKERLLGKLKALENEINTIKRSFPYSAKDMLNDPVALAKKQEQLNEIIGRYEEIVAELKTVYEDLKDELLNPKSGKNKTKKDSSENADEVKETAGTEPSTTNSKPVEKPMEDNHPAKNEQAEPVGNEEKPKKDDASKKKQEPVEFWE